MTYNPAAAQRLVDRVGAERAAVILAEAGHPTDAATAPAGAPEPGSLEDIFGPVIHAYTRAQAIADGVLVDVTEAAREVGFSVPVALTRAAWLDLVHWTEETEKRKGFTGQCERGRLHDVVWMAYLAARRGTPRDRMLYQMIRTPEKGRGLQARKVVVKAVCGPGDEGEPVVTLMLPDED